MTTNHVLFVAVTCGVQDIRDAVSRAMPTAMLEKSFRGIGGSWIASLLPVAKSITVPISWGRSPDIIYR